MISLNQKNVFFFTNLIFLSPLFFTPIISKAGEKTPCGDEAGRAELIAMKQAEQSLRRALFSMKEAVDQDELRLKDKELEETDLKNQAALDRIIQLCGWPGYSTFGRDAARAAELIAVHAEKPDKYFPIIESEFKKNNVSEDIYAILIDKILIKEGKLQKYGSQIDSRTNQPMPIDDPEHVNERRMKLGLPTLDGFPVAPQESNPVIKTGRNKKRKKPANVAK